MVFCAHRREVFCECDSKMTLNEIDWSVQSIIVTDAIIYKKNLKALDKGRGIGKNPNSIRVEEELRKHYYCTFYMKSIQ